ncbi:HlyD family type I secretion periplasmic adaptor subunit [Vibrio sp. RE86]|uniref:HlyD family type I secretion periplasmic adaptor subunit n=1 Tax=Vibrio sp. RE86 TaxID=2607605 RepID=UPI001493C12F|nr:HlyD family type I secretion periplasmic adaptor subunit [Vibrio sp. RE86]NOH80074.1 HlyD family type I secretion periplasmic adaptor subunit [Vibrio sp. RE86]
MTSTPWNSAHLAYRSRRLIWLSAACIAAIVGWATWAKLEEVVIGEGKVVPSLSVQTIQSLEGGLVKELLVRQGERVTRGQPIAILDDTRFRASFQESNQQAESLYAQQQRLKAEINSIKVLSSSLPWQDQIVFVPQGFDINEQSHLALINARANYLERMGQIKSELEESTLRIEQQAQSYSDTLHNIRTLKSSLNIVTKERDMLKAVVESGAVAEVELLKLNRDVIKLNGDIASAEAVAQKQKAAYSEAITDRRSTALEFRTKVQGQLNEVTAKLAQLSESRHAIADQLKRTQLVSPVDGRVKEIFVRTIGGVVKPGEPIMELIPEDSNLIVEARIAPKDIAFVRTGLPATVKFSAYDFVIYGGLKGQVTYVSADALQTEDGNAYYRAHIALSSEAEKSGFTIIPGMQVAVDILTGEKTVLSYWLKPILRAKENALRER